MYESSKDGLVSLSELAKGLGIAGLKTKISKEDFPVTEFVKLKELYVDEKYQRLLNEQMIKKAEKFDPRLSRPLLTYKRPDGKRAIVDGQHTGCIAFIYTENPEDTEVYVQTLVHDSDLNVTECVEEEAQLFKKLNVLRTNVSAVAQLRSDLAAGQKDAVETCEILNILGVHVEKIGDETGYGVKGYSKLMEATSTYDIMCVKDAIEYYTSLVESTNPNWKNRNRELNGALIGGLSAIFTLKEFLRKGTQKHQMISDYLEGGFLAKATTPKELMKGTAGNAQFVLIARRIVEHASIALKLGVIQGDSIGEKTLEKAKLGDPSKVTSASDED